ncbi:PREDICTED: hemicentin-2-like [Branchiostoma belcheri]|uniref:Hemicentin-2-like n=1 Tax=Branchiostoma belcheri TaxID=7741 RepID=A0A6P5A7A6_BRABE|nr:PREDICTED: hemicentin-2-like [Branchiostoma belcheri]
MRRRAGRDTLLVKRLGWFLRDGRRGRGRADRLDLCKMCCKPERRTGTLFRQCRSHLHITMAVLLLVSVIRYGLVEAAAAPSVQTPVVDVVHGNVGEDVTLPVRVRTDHQVFAQTWNKLYGGVHSMREAVYMDSPSTGTAMSLGSLKGRASLGPDGSLRIHRAGPDDEGMYVLSVLMDVVGQKEHYVTLQMHVPPQVDFSEPSPLHAMQNSLVTLNCTVRHSSVLLQDVQWKKDGSQLWERRTANQQHHGNGQWMDVMTYTESDDVLTSVLTFQAVKREDSGNYTCHAHHRGGIVVASLFLEVFYSAKIINISESPQLVLENANVTLDCVAEGNPPPILSWHKDGDYSSLKSTFSDAGWHRERVGRLNLTLLRFREGDSGVYTCEATNGVPSGRKDNKSVLVAMMQVKAITAPGPETEAENAIIVERDPSTPNDVYQQGGEIDNDFYSTLVTVGIVTVTALSLLLLLAVGFLLCRRKKAVGTKILKTNIRRDVVRHRHLGQSREVEVYR